MIKQNYEPITNNQKGNSNKLRDSSASPQVRFNRTQNDNRFVSRGGIKLQAAIENWKLLASLRGRSGEIGNLTCLDVGSSTGGFVDCLLQNGASKVYSVDTAYGELAWKLRNDPRVIVMERTNILHLDSLPVIPSKEGISPEKKDPRIREDDKGLVDLITIDAGWTKLELVLPVVKKFLKPGGRIIALLKPQYEAEKNQLVKGIVKSDELEKVVERVKSKIYDLGFKIEVEMESPILGGGGNREYLLLIASEI